MPLHRVEEIMGMPVTVHIADPGPAAEAAEAAEEAFEDFRVLDRTFSAFLPESAVSRINRGELNPVAAGPLVEQVVRLCDLYAQATGGFFAGWLDGRFDPAGLVKGWAIDRAASILDRRGLRSFFVDAGGDVQTRGANGARGPWRVGVRHPHERERLACVVLAADLAIATSGIYEKGRHLVDPHTGALVTHWLSLTVTGPDILTADVYATAACAMGEAGLAFMEAQQGYEALGIDADLAGAWTSGFLDLCDPAVRPTGVSRPA